MDGVKVLLTLLEGVPAYATLTIATVVGVFSIWLYSRKIDISAIASLGQIQSAQISDLQELVKTLTDELRDARAEIAEINSQNQELRKHIIKLEMLMISNNLTPPEHNLT